MLRVVAEAGLALGGERIRASRHKSQDYLSNFNIEMQMKEAPEIIELLHEVEYILGNQCYNGNIQNYGAWGQWEGEGRSFRYPVRYYDEEDEIRKYSSKLPRKLDENFKKKSVFLSEEEMSDAHYAFGANHLYVFRGLKKILNYLEDRYAISFLELEKAIKSKED